MNSNRRSPRVELHEPIQGRIAGRPVTILDLSEEGAGIEHSHPLQIRSSCILEIPDRDIAVRASVQYTQLKRLAQGDKPGLYHTGLALRDVTDAQVAAIHGMLDEVVRERILEWEANATATRRRDIDTVRKATHPREMPRAFLWFRLRGGQWQQTTVLDPNQPIDGFAVCDDEPFEQIELLKKAYEHYDAEFRDVLRLMAHLAISSRLGKEP